MADGRVSLMTRIEVLREELEARLGLDCLRAVCRRMEGVRPDDPQGALGLISGGYGRAALCRTP